MQYFLIGDSFGIMAIGIFFTSLVAYLATVTRKREAGQWSFPEPESTGLLLISYLSFSYTCAWVLSQVVQDYQPILVTGILFALLTIAHLLVKRLVALASKLASETATRAAEPLEARISDLENDERDARLVLTRVHESAGLYSVYSGPMDSALLDALSDDIKNSVSLRAWASDPNEFFGHSTGAVGQQLSRACNLGTPMRLLSFSSPTGSLIPRNVDLVVAAEDFPESWILECTGALYVGAAGVPGAQMASSVLRLVPSALGPGHPGLFELFHGVLERLERSAKLDIIPGKVLVGRGPELYRKRILQLESGAERIDRVAKRIFIVFKDEETVREIARQRYGAGHQYQEHYIREHEERREAISTLLQRGRVVREIYSAKDLINYVTSGQHGASATLAKRNLAGMLSNWRKAIEDYPNYHVAISTEHLPLHYEVIDSKHVVLHEAIGFHENERINSIFMQSGVVAGRFQSEFDSLWDRTPIDLRQHGTVLAWISTNLEPLLDGTAQT